MALVDVGVSCNSVGLSSSNVGTRSLRLAMANVFGIKAAKTASSSASLLLNDVSFSLSAGDRLGLIGSNGAGKTTLLRLLAGIYVPSLGTIDINGRIGSLLDLNLGFDSEADALTNIKIGAAHLLIPPSVWPDLSAHVIAFSELGDAIHKPIKNYSSGMLVRLVYALLMFADFDVYLVDEIIGVGDKRFLDKSSRHFAEKVGKDKILIIASHSEGLLRQYCNQGLVLKNGTMLFHGEIGAALNFYNSAEYLQV